MKVAEWLLLSFKKNPKLQTHYFVYTYAHFFFKCSAYIIASYS